MGGGRDEGEKRGGYVYICVGVPVLLCLHCIGEYCPHLHLLNIYLDISYKKNLNSASVAGSISKLFP